ncbi:MAG: SAM-dependent methyltransferase [Nitrospira sp.]
MHERRRPDDSQKRTGTLYLVGMPIGHPDDLGRRALSILRTVDIIATEDPRATQRLLRHYRTSAALTSYGPVKIKEKVALLIQQLRFGRSVALVSDCGSPVVADPGSLLVAAAHRHRIPIRSIPGPSALTAAIAAAGFHGDAGHFYGNLPATNTALKRKLTATLKHREPVVLFVEAEYLTSVVSFIAQESPRRSIAVCENLGLASECVRKGTARRIARIVEPIQPSETITIVIGPGPRSGRR